MATPVVQGSVQDGCDGVRTKIAFVELVFLSAA